MTLQGQILAWFLKGKSKRQKISRKSPRKQNSATHPHRAEENEDEEENVSVNVRITTPVSVFAKALPAVPSIKRNHK